MGTLILVFAAVSLIVLFFGRHFLGGMVGLYRVVPVNEAHVRILKDKKGVFSSRTEKSSYWYIPFMTKLHKLPLSNLSVPVNDIKLNDKDMAKFLCDIACFINISNIELAIERLTLTPIGHELGFDFQKLLDDLRAVMESIGRTVAAKQTLLEIYRDRTTLDRAITQEIEAVFPKWGISLVGLELKDIKDAPGSTVIQDIERLRASEVRRDAEIRLAETARDANIKTAEANQMSEIAKAKSEEAYRKQQIEKDRQIALAEQRKNEEVEIARSKVNTRSIEALRELEFGKAEIARQVAEKNAEASKIQVETAAAAEAKKTLIVGQAQADIVKASKIADAEGTTQQAIALAKFNDAAMNVKMLDIQKEVLIAKFQAMAQALSKAEIKWIVSGANAGSLFGMSFDAENGASLNQFLEESGLTLEKIKSLLPIKKDDAKSK